jgi:hypothetical protein
MILRFRWAVCQIDILQRIQNTNDVSIALMELPEDLDATYERIFDLIPAQERNLVQRTLSLLCGLSFLSNSVKDHILLSMIYQNWNHQPGVVSDYFCDTHTLKDVCGCLITISDEIVTLAHFTVAEFLYSSRLRTNPNHNIRLFALSGEIVKTEMIRTILSGAIAYFGPISSLEDSTCDLYDFLLFHGNWAIKRFQDEVIREHLQVLAYEFLNPIGRHFERLKVIFRGRFYPIAISITPTSNHDAIILIQLVQNECLQLARLFLEGKDTYSLLQARLAVVFGQVILGKGPQDDVRFEGSVRQILDCYNRLYSKPELARFLDSLQNISS